MYWFSSCMFWVYSIQMLIVSTLRWTSNYEPKIYRGSWALDIQTHQKSLPRLWMGFNFLVHCRGVYLLMKHHHFSPRNTARWGKNILHPPEQVVKIKCGQTILPPLALDIQSHRKLRWYDWTLKTCLIKHRTSGGISDVCVGHQFDVESMRPVQKQAFLKHLTPQKNATQSFESCFNQPFQSCCLQNPQNNKAHYYITRYSNFHGNFQKW